MDTDDALQRCEDAIGANRGGGMMYKEWTIRNSAVYRKGTEARAY